jgi:hypothetical protein
LHSNAYERGYDGIECVLPHARTTSPASGMSSTCAMLASASPENREGMGETGIGYVLGKEVERLEKVTLLCALKRPKNVSFHP